VKTVLSEWIESKRFERSVKTDCKVRVVRWHGKKDALLQLFPCCSVKKRRLCSGSTDWHRRVPMEASPLEISGRLVRRPEDYGHGLVSVVAE